ncbi:hypothetical protein JOC54_001616 [Alkalihalobacillus xiaoxiensis]|uniref:Uncharacterized protein n=1 Tax=Shouchella xiaoxiensis TaxID=766895 RepID=A0ABS2SS79_9BACI|nr:hypothetical protein [Shouchella xiaoxiensis]
MGGEGYAPARLPDVSTLRAKIFHFGGYTVRTPPYRKRVGLHRTFRA